MGVLGSHGEFGRLCACACPLALTGGAVLLPVPQVGWIGLGHGQWVAPKVMLHKPTRLGCHCGSRTAACMRQVKLAEETGSSADKEGKSNEGEEKKGWRNEKDEHMGTEG